MQHWLDQKEETKADLHVKHTHMQGKCLRAHSILSLVRLLCLSCFALYSALFVLWLASLQVQFFVSRREASALFNCVALKLVEIKIT